MMPGQQPKVHPTAQNAMRQGTGGLHHPIAKRQGPKLAPARPDTGKRPSMPAASLQSGVSPQLAQLLHLLPRPAVRPVAHPGAPGAAILARLLAARSVMGGR